MSLKEKNFCKVMVDTRNATEAAFQSYNVSSRESAEVIGTKCMKRPKIREEIEKLMEDKNITDDVLMRKLKQGLGAKIVASYKGVAKETDIPDHNTRFKYWEAGAKLKNYFPATQIDTRNFNIDLELEKMSIKELSGFLREFLISLKNEPVKENK